MLVPMSSISSARHFQRKPPPNIKNRKRVFKELFNSVEEHVAKSQIDEVDEDSALGKK